MEAPFRMRAHPRYDNYKTEEEVNAVKTSEIKFLSLGFLMTDL